MTVHDSATLTQRASEAASLRVGLVCTPCPEEWNVDPDALSGPARLESLLQGSLPPPEQSALTEHVGDCTACQQALDGLAAGPRSPSSNGRTRQTRLRLGLLVRRWRS